MTVAVVMRELLKPSLQGQVSDTHIQTNTSQVAFFHLLGYKGVMSDNLYDLLENNDPVALHRIEKALISDEKQNDTIEAVISALIWRRCTAGQNGVLGAILNYECAARISVLPDHLEQVGAMDAAKAIRDLRREIPLKDEQIRSGIIDWVDLNPEIASNAARLNDGVDDIAPTVWNFMQERQDDLPDPVIPNKTKGFFASLFAMNIQYSR